MTTRPFNDAELADIIARVDAGEKQVDIAKDYKCSNYRIFRAYHKYKDVLNLSSTHIAQTLAAASLANQKRSTTARQAKAALENIITANELLEQFKELIGELPERKFTKPKAPPKHKDRSDITMEVMLSDLHFGKQTATFDIDVAKQRLRKFVRVVENEFVRKQAHYNVERIVVAFLGDIIENETMHGIESSRGSQFGNAEQTMAAVDLLLCEVMIPLYNLGVPITVLGITGNHDRDGEKKTYHNPGRYSYTWIIYQTLKLFANHYRMSEITWDIPDGVYTTLDIYGDTILYEHSDHINGRVFDKKVLLSQIAKRGAQVNKVIKGIRVGHYHEATCVDNGRVVGNGSLCGTDSYADINGFISVPAQTITFYVRTKNRSTSFYYSFPVYLGD